MLDFVKEANALEEVGANIMPYFSNVVIPQPYKEYCNSDILVMEYLPGVKLLDAVVDDYKRVARKLGLTMDELATRMMPGSKAPPLTWSMYLTLASDVALQKVSAAVQTIFVFLYNNTVGWVAQPKRYPRRIDAPKLMKTLIDVHAKEILIDGIFNGIKIPIHQVYVDRPKLNFKI
jgi:aarF domain-containing kinase